MNPPPDSRTLLARHLAGETLDAAEWRRLLEELESAPGFGEEAVEQVIMDRLLRHHAVDAGAEAFAGEVKARLASTPGEEGRENSLEHRVLGRLARRRQAFWLAALLAPAAAAALWLAGVFQAGVLQKSAPGSGSGSGPGPGPVIAARFIGLTSAVLENGAVPGPGASLTIGQHVGLRSGFAAIRFEQGAEVILEGTADLEITGVNRATLHFGSAVARVPDSAHGFTIDGPGGKIVDLGTEFAVRAAGSRMDVRVLEGKVEAHPAVGSMVPLTVNESLCLTDAGSEASQASALDFLTRLPPGRQVPVLWLHWTFDEGSGSTVAASGNGFPLEDAMGRLTALPGATDVPAWSAGIRGGGLEFKGRNDYVQTGFSGISGSQPRTVACWVKVPPDLTENEGFALVSWGTHDQPGDTWQVSINSYSGDGPAGRLRVGTHNGQVIGLTDLRDGKWHHVAAVLYEGHPADVSTHVLLYVDGQLEPAARKSIRSIDTNTTGTAAQRVAFGKNSAVRDANNTSLPAHTFRGCIDEITLCGAALAESEIRHLMTTGECPDF